MANSYKYEIVSVPANGETVDQVRAAASKQFPGFVIEGVALVDNEWEVRLAKLVKGDFPFKKKDDEGSDDDGDGDGDMGDGPSGKDDKDPDDDGDDDTSEDGDTDKDNGGGFPGGDGGSSKDPVKQIQKLLNEVQKLFGELKEKADKVDEIHDSIKDHVGDGGPEMPGDMGGMPGGAPGGAPPIPKGPQPPMNGPDGRKPPLRPGSPSGIPTFTKKKKTEFARFAKRTAAGQEVGLAQALAELESDPEWAGYKVVNVTDEGEKFVAELKLTEE